MENTDQDRQYRKYNKMWLLCFVAGLLLFISAVVWVDPCFHYHAPLKGMSYLLNNQRYQNNGIVRFFDYDALITGTSMTENFRTSELDEIFQVNSIKASFSGGAYKEINDNVLVALDANPDIKMILRGLDLYMIIADKDALSAIMTKQGYRYPYFMIDNNPFNDVEYALNKEWLFEGIRQVSRALKGEAGTSFDEYSYWNDDYQFGAEAVLSDQQIMERCREKAETTRELTEEEIKMIIDNIIQNVTSTADSYPETEFYLFYPPYSIVWWDSKNSDGTIDCYIDAMETAAEEMLKYDNIKLFDFCGNYEMICNLDNYKDEIHYSAEINSQMLLWMRDGEYLLTADNYETHFEEMRDFYNHYDYNGFFDEIAAERGME